MFKTRKPISSFALIFVTLSKWVLLLKYETIFRKQNKLFKRKQEMSMNPMTVTGRLQNAGAKVILVTTRNKTT